MHPLVSQLTTQNAPAHRQRISEQSLSETPIDQGIDAENESFQKVFETGNEVIKQQEPQISKTTEEADNTDFNQDQVATISDVSGAKVTRDQTDPNKPGRHHIDMHSTKDPLASEGALSKKDRTDSGSITIDRLNAHQSDTSRLKSNSLLETPAAVAKETDSVLPQQIVRDAPDGDLIRNPHSATTTVQQGAYITEVSKTAPKTQPMTNPKKSQAELLIMSPDRQLSQNSQITFNTDPLPSVGAMPPKIETSAPNFTAERIPTLNGLTAVAPAMQVGLNITPVQLDHLPSRAHLAANNLTPDQLTQDLPFAQPRPNAQTQADSTRPNDFKFTETPLSTARNLPTYWSHPDVNERRDLAENSPVPLVKGTSAATLGISPMVLPSATIPIIKGTSNPLSADLLAPHHTDLSTNVITQQGASLARTELPIQIARQLTEVLQNAPTRPVEITLSPEELGRVRLSVTSSESGIVVNVLAERPETSELMRRHIEQLAQEFQELGYQDISFSFSGMDHDPSDERKESASDNQNDRSALETTDSDRQTGQIHLSSGNTSGLDLRL